MMEVRSLTLRTELFFWRAFSVVREMEDHIVVRTPDKPGWYGGNIILFEDPPVEEDFKRWRTLFQAEFGSDPRIRHHYFTWSAREGTPPSLERFLAEGYEHETERSLAANGVHPPPHPNSEIEIRPIVTEEEWEEVIANQVACRHPRFALESYTGFVRGRMKDYRTLIATGAGNWYGAFLDGRVVGDLGLFRQGTLARFQIVSTHPEYRRRGICGTLVYEVSRRGLAEGIEQLVMAADENYHAARIYESVGFRPYDRAEALILFPPDERLQ